jgi:methanethiol oxidase
VTGLAVYNNKGDFLSAHAIPTDNGGDGIAINPKKNVFLTSSFTGWNNYMMDIGKLIKDAEAMKHFGNTMVMWNLKSIQPEKIFSVPGAPLEIRWSLKEDDDWAITFSALTSKLWLISHDANNEWQAREVATIGDPAKIPMPVDASISADAKTLWVNTFMDGTTHLFDISDPAKPVQIYEKVTGKQVNMISQSWDGKRVYITSSLLSNWNKKGADNEQVLRAYDWDGKNLTQKFEVDFLGEKLGRPHHMKFSGEGFARHAPSRGSAMTKKWLCASPKRALWKAALAAAQILAAALPAVLGAQAATGLLPPPGSYKLNHIERVPQAIVLEATRFPRLLSHYMQGSLRF